MSESANRPVTSEERKIETERRDEMGGRAEEVMEDLQRLRGQPAREGNTHVKRMEELRLLPWSQRTMITVGTLNNVLRTGLQEELALRRGWYGAGGLLVSSIRELCCHWLFMRLKHRNQSGHDKIPHNEV